LNDDAAPSFSMPNTAYDVATLLEFTRVLFRSAQATESVSYATSLPGADTASQNDFTAASGTLTFAAGVTAQTFTVQTTPDTLFEIGRASCRESVNATDGAVTSQTAGTATGTIL